MQIPESPCDCQPMDEAQRANAYRLLEDALNLRDTKIYDTVKEEGTEKRVLNKKETMLAQQKQESIRDEFKGLDLPGYRQA